MKKLFLLVSICVFSNAITFNGLDLNLLKEKIRVENKARNTSINCYYDFRLHTRVCR